MYSHHVLGTERDLSLLLVVRIFYRFVVASEADWSDPILSHVTMDWMD